MKEAKYALSRRRPLQFGVRSLLIIMAAASCLFSFARVVFESRERARDTPPEPNNLVVGNGAYHECEPHYRWSRAPQGSDIRGARGIGSCGRRNARFRGKTNKQRFTRS